MRRASRRSSTRPRTASVASYRAWERINAEVDLNLIVATGVHAFLELPNFLGYRSVDAIAELFVANWEGIDDTGVKAAFIKCAVERHGIIGDIPKFPGGGLDGGDRDGRAGDGAHERGRGHWPAGARGTDLSRRRAGRIVIAHAGDSNDLAYLRAIADTGAGSAATASRSSTSTRTSAASRRSSALLAEGYGDRVHLSHDAACFIDFMVGDPAFANESRTTCTSRRRSSRPGGMPESPTSRSTS